jgi:hypothetical protein
MERKPTYAELIAAGVSPEEARRVLAEVEAVSRGPVLVTIRGRLRRVPKKAAEMARAAEERRMSLADMGRSKCWVCGEEFEDSHFCDNCKTFICPHCGTHFCSLPEEAKKALDAEMYTLGLWSPYTNPCRRKRRR